MSFARNFYTRSARACHSFFARAARFRALSFAGEKESARAREREREEGLLRQRAAGRWLIYVITVFISTGSNLTGGVGAQLAPDFYIGRRARGCVMDIDCEGLGLAAGIGMGTGCRCWRLL